VELVWVKGALLFSNVSKEVIEVVDYLLGVSDFAAVDDNLVYVNSGVLFLMSSLSSLSVRHVTFMSLTSDVIFSK
jgi:hypothetical protein